MSLVISRLHVRHDSTTALVDGLPPRLRRLFSEADVANDHLIALGIWMGTAPFVAGLAALVFGWGAAAGSVLCMAGLPLGLITRWSGRRNARLVASLPDLIDGVARALRSGASLHQALHEVATDQSTVAAVELRIVLTAVESGSDLTHALANWAERRPIAEVRVVSAALGLVVENEAGTGRALSGVSDTLRDRKSLADEIRALTSQAATSMQALVFLPIGFLAIDLAGDGGVVSYLGTEPIGRLCLAGGVVLNLVGWRWMRGTINRQMPT